jgi:hypothetical protein
VLSSNQAPQRGEHDDRHEQSRITSTKDVVPAWGRGVVFAAGAYG